MKKVRLEGWYQRRRLGGAGFIRPGIPVIACNDQVKRILHLVILGHKGYMFLLQQQHCKGLLGTTLYPELQVHPLSVVSPESPVMPMVWVQTSLYEDKYKSFNCFEFSQSFSAHGSTAVHTPMFLKEKTNCMSTDSCCKIVVEKIKEDSPYQEFASTAESMYREYFRGIFEKRIFCCPSTQSTRVKL
ncbi:hypothetical protein BTVI_107295 [Pitangus sulphuratus]|nr:hypothetical protein BTVI_107295 [Pitangus sulphuratus]